jgi:cytochrome c oxidase subunit 2
LRPAVTDAKLRRRRRRGALLVTLAVALGASLLLAPGALANFITPKSGGSPNANEIDSLYKIILYIAIVVFAIVEGTLLYSLFKFRAKRGAVAAQIHGNTALEIGWTVAAAVILVVLAVITFVKLPNIINPPNSSANGLVLSASTTEPSPPNGKKLNICVTGRQFIWRYTYGSDCKGDPFGKHLPYSYYEMDVPADTTVVLAIQATDVIHSWWIPSLGGKFDAVPGYTQYTWFKASKVGAVYHGQCAQLCGREHYAMRAVVRVLRPDEYRSWLAQQSANINAANQQVGTLRQELAASGQILTASPTP